MCPDIPPEKSTSTPPFPLLPAAGAIIVVLVNAWIIWFFLVSIPAGCTRLAAETGGRQTCGVEPGAYAIVGISAVLVVAAVYYLFTMVGKRIS